MCSSKEHFHEILQALMYLPKEGYCEFPLNFEPEVLEFSLWSRMENPNLPLICDFLEKVLGKTAALKLVGVSALK